MSGRARRQYGGAQPSRHRIAAAEQCASRTAGTFSRYHTSIVRQAARGVNECGRRGWRPYLVVRGAEERSMRTIYERLALRPVINGVGTVTRLGGSLMPRPVLEAMVEAARQYVPLADLQAAAGRRLAELTRNEAAYVSSGAAAGLVLATAACITGDDQEKMALLPHPERIPGGRHKVIV